MAESNDRPETRAEEAWQEVGRQFESLGVSLSKALHEAWDDDRNRQAVGEMESALKSMARAIADTVDEAAASPEGRELRDEAERVAATAVAAGKQASETARPQIVAALRSLRDGLQAAIDELQGPGEAPSSEAG